MKSGKRLLALVLAVTMVFSMGLTGAFATGANGNDSGQDSGTLTATVTANPATIKVDATSALTVVVKHKATGDSGAETTVDAANYTVTYASGTPATATVSDSTLTGVAAGSTEITATVTGKGDTYAGLTATAKVTVTVEAKDEPTAATPSITTDLKTETVSYVQGDVAKALSITATASDGGSLSFAWTVTGANSTSATRSSTSATGDILPGTKKVGTTTYSCIVTNTKEGKTATVNSATTTIVVTEKSAVSPDKTALKAAITAAEKATVGVEVSTDGKDIEPTAMWTTKANADKLMAAITTAKAVNNKSNATQNEVTTATATLNAAKETFVNALQNGKKPTTPTTVDKTALKKLINEMNNAKDGAKTSVDGKDVVTTERWTTQAHKDTLSAAIAKAILVRENENATKDDVANAVTALTTAGRTFLDTWQDGTKEGAKPTPPPVVKPDDKEVTEADKAVSDAGNAAKEEIKSGIAAQMPSDPTPALKAATDAVINAITNNVSTAELAKTVTENIEKFPASMREDIKRTVTETVTQAADDIAMKSDASKEEMNTQDIKDLEDLLVAVGVPQAKTEGTPKPAAMSGATLSSRMGAQITVIVSTPTAKPEELISLPENTTNSKVIELNIDEDGEDIVVRVKAPITLTFNCSDLGLSSTAKNIEVFHINSDNKAVKLNKVSISGGKITFTVGSFSSIVFAEVSTGSTNKPSSGSSGGGSKSSLTFGGSSASTVDNTSANVNSDGSVNASTVASDATQAVKNALAKKQTKANIVVENAQSITPAALVAIADAAKKAGGTATICADTTYNGKTIARIAIDPVKAAALGKEIKLSVATDNASVAGTINRFEKFYTNKLVVASFAQQGSFGTTVNAAVRLDLSGLNVKTLRLYSFDKAANKFYPISTAGMFVDANGFLHFNTMLGGDVVVTDAPLAAKK